MSVTYPEFFLRVTGNSPLPYQERYSKDPFSPVLLIIPTGLGKTDAVLVPWLYRHFIQDTSTPTRLHLVLPRQNLTQQTARNARARVKSAELSEQIEVLELMAGSQDNDEKLRPTQRAIIVSTQDLYFSRALNRGYARRSPRWPIDFALYNQDSLIVLDEIQLMDEALATSTQLAAFRKRYETVGKAVSVWMSATVNPSWLQTVDAPVLPRIAGLDADDRANPLVNRRIRAAKTVGPAPIECGTPAGCASFVMTQHRPDTRTLVIANTVPRAREIFQAIHKQFKNTILLHSRFRPGDRQGTAAMLGSIPAEGQVVVATQVLEAGVDITSRVLVTDLAPWGSMVQRFGRVNRYGDDADAAIWWVARPTYSKQKDFAAPYNERELEMAARKLQDLHNAASADLPVEDGPAPYMHVLRAADLLDLFDTTPDLGGNDLDVSRFIRATEDKSVYLAWRDWPAGEEPATGGELADEELCPIPLGEFREFIKKHQTFTLNFATDEWMDVRDTVPYPGMLALTRTKEGGYSSQEGWSPESKATVPPAPATMNREKDTDSSDIRSFQKYRQTLRAHTERVRSKLEDVIAHLSLPDEWKDDLRTAALKHDWGKVHEVFQDTMRRAGPCEAVLAKQCGRAKHSRKHFRHELASALAMLQNGDSDLAAYLAAAHHGRIRLGIRSMPGEQEEDGLAVARGIRDGDQLPECELAAGTHTSPLTLSLTMMQLGAENGSWTDRMVRLRDKLGPFRLAYLEMLLRTADEEASEDPGSELTACPTSN